MFLFSYFVSSFGHIVFSLIAHPSLKGFSKKPVDLLNMVIFVVFDWIIIVILLMFREENWIIAQKLSTFTINASVNSLFSLIVIFDRPDGFVGEGSFSYRQRFSFNP